MWKYFKVDPEHLHHHEVNLQKVFRYAKAMERGDKFPPVKVGIDKRDGKMCVRDGAHRTVAAKMAGVKLFIKCKAELRRTEEHEPNRE